MTNQRAYGDSHPNRVLDAKTVRDIRLLHLCEGISASQISRDLQMNISCISRIVNWKAWARQDHDLRVIPKPVHKGGHAYHTRPTDYSKLSRPEPKRSCRGCLHLNDDGLCDFGFPECLRSGYREAETCNVYQPLKQTYASPNRH